jgi:hypothetical protein
MRICIDSCVFIEGLQQSDDAAVQLLDLIGPELILLIPRLVAQEVTRNPRYAVTATSNNPAFSTAR